MNLDLTMYLINLLLVPLLVVAIFYLANKKKLNIDAKFLVSYTAYTVGLIIFIRLLKVLLRPIAVTFDYSSVYYTLLSLLISFILLKLMNTKVFGYIIKLKDKVYYADKSSSVLRSFIFYGTTGMIFLFAVLLYIVSDWSVDFFELGLEQIIFTITSPLKEADSKIAEIILKRWLPYMVLIIFSFASFMIVSYKKGRAVYIDIKLRKSHRMNLTKIFRAMVVVMTAAALIFSFLFVNRTYDLIGYVFDKAQQSTIYEEYYIDPRSVDFKSPKQKKNLIYIYLESMETTYASKAAGGFQDENYIPNLTNLLDQGISFSNKEGPGGFVSLKGMNFTMGALLATTSGVHFGFPVRGNGLSEYQDFAPGLVTLGDILDQQGYVQEFLCGSDANYAGRRNYFEQHGNYGIFDLFTAREKGYIPKDYNVFWGYEDLYLYKIAKDELTRLAAQDKPFNLTMLTVDTHHISGYVCEKCKKDHDVQTANVVECADNQLKEFVQWIKLQDFYEESVIVITGDHPRMDKELVENIAYNERSIYNLMMNSETKVRGATINRDFSALDIFPTTLSALGFTWGSNKLGLGTDMFSGENTLLEDLSIEHMNSEFSKKSSYFLDEFQ